MTELLLGPVIGGLTHDSAYLWGRADGPSVLHAWLGRNPDLSDARLTGTSLPLSSDTGFAGVAVTKELQPNSRYYYALTLSGSPPTPATEGVSSFTTAPSPGERLSFSFAFGSCFRPENADGGRIFDAIEEQERLMICALSCSWATRSMLTPTRTMASARSPVRCKNTGMCTLTPGRGRPCRGCWQTCQLI